MRAIERRLLWAVLAVASLAMLSFPGSRAGDGGRGKQTPAGGGRLIVHEWGTFTNFSGSNGIQLDFRPLLDSDLPEFVYDRSMQSSSIFSKSFYARQRMETPVTYFYTDRA